MTSSTEERRFSRATWSPMAYQTTFRTDTGHAMQGLHGPAIVDFYTHMRKSRTWTAKDWENADKFNPLPNDHLGRKDNSNEQPRHELYLLGPGEKKVTEEPDTRIPSTSTFTFNKEDHTLGNMLTSRLHQSQHVVFAAYKVPHPLVSNFSLRVGTDGSLTPRAAVLQACRELVNDLALLNQEFTKEFELRKMVGADAKAESIGMHAGGTAEANGTNHHRRG